MVWLPPRLATLAPLDWCIVGGYGLAVILIALWASRRQSSSEEYLLGGRNLPWWAVGVSIIATAFSSISLVVWTGYAYYQGPHWLQLQLGELAAILVVCVVFLPYFARLNITTAYEYLDRRFGRTARWIASAVFHVVVLARGGLFLFLTAQVLSVFTGLDEPACILIVGLAAMIYSSVGGLGAVVWTDGLQMLLVVGGVIAAVVLVVSELPGGWADVQAATGGFGDRAPVDLSLDLARWPTLLSAFLAYGVFALAVGGTNQQAVQRYLACQDLRASRRAALLSWAVGALVTALTLTLGVALHARFGGDPLHPLNADLPTAHVDKVFATFVSGHLPVGLAGVLAAAVFAASMSSIDSAIHSMATATLVDFVEPLRRTPLEDAARLRLARRLTLLYGVLAVGAAFFALSQGRAVLDMLLDWLGYLVGPILGLFLLGMLTRGVGHAGALLGLLAGYGAVILGFTTWFTVEPQAGVWVRALALGDGLHGIWAALVGCVATVVVGGLTPWGRVRGIGRPSP
ncbi:MAG: sodium/solute symporter [Planctomycetota bacterium]|nr:sodium/solute symporter [Planctomycetota bacterium]